MKKSKLIQRLLCSIIFILFLIKVGYSQVLSDLDDSNDEIFYAKASFVYSKFFVRIVGNTSPSSFSKEWEYRPSGNISIGLNQSLGISDWSIFIELGALVHRSKHRFAMYNLNQLAVIGEFGVVRKINKIRLGCAIWGASLPDSKISLRRAPFTSSEVKKFWFGIAPRISYALGSKVFVNGSLHYGATTIYKESINGVGGSSYGDTSHRPGWIELGCVLFL